LGGRELGTIAVKRGELGKGDQFVEFDGHNAVYNTNGKLFRCKCIATEWHCEEHEGGATYCYEMCLAWECTEVPTSGTLKG
jgi:hypothetical protein